MCGIAGYLNFDPQRPVEEALLVAMTRQIAHRGPDDQGIYINNNLGLAHRRLSILDLTSAGHQPMPTADGRYWIAYNGEVYNFPELRKELAADGYPFRSRTDTEVILALYQKMGKSFLSRLEGMYAFAIWDTVEKELFLARDPLGIKPLYYFHDDQHFAFASEMKALLALPFVPRELDPEGVQNFFAHGHSTAPVSICRHIRKLLPGHSLAVNDGKLQEANFWHPQIAPDRSHDSKSLRQQKADALEELLFRAIESHLISDVPVGVFLSGGLDSSAMVALMSRLGHRQIKTFSVGFDASKHFSELDDARIVAKHFRTDHHEMVLTEKELLAGIKQLVYHFDEPFGDPAAFPTYFVSQLAAKHVKVCLSGEGGDELFGGYRRYLTERYGGLYRMLPGMISNRLIPAVVGKVPRSRRLKQLIRTVNINDPSVRQANWQMVFTDEMRHQLFADSIFDSHADQGVYESFRRYRCPKGTDGMSGVLYADTRAWLADRYLEKADKMSMAHGLESRVPFLDKAVVEFAFRLPIDDKVKLNLKRKGRSLKRLLGLVLEDLLPRAILDKPKHGFAVPLDPWFRGELSDFVADILFDQRTRQRGYFDMKMIEKLFNDHKTGKEVRSNHLWLLILFELWHRRFLD